MSVAISTKLDFWVRHNKNVLFLGKHGVGKTAMVRDTFDRHKLKWRYFSASTMDPWCDFIGVPREKSTLKIPRDFEVVRELAKINLQTAVTWVVKNWKLEAKDAMAVVSHAVEQEDGVTYLDLVRPHQFATGDIEALFFDEFNRSPKKVRNAVLELIQFQSINGMKFPNLRFVWAAINPDDDQVNDYDVEKLDPAQVDRFHVKVEVPYKPNAEWFRQEYGSRMADSAISWWDELPEEEKNNVSPRRLQYALDVFVEKGDMRDVLPPSCGVSKLISTLNNGPTIERLEALHKSGDKSAAGQFLDVENNYASAIKYILKSDKFMDFFGPLLPKEKISSLMETDEAFCGKVINGIATDKVYHKICKDIMAANQNAKMCKKIRRALTEDETLKVAFQSELQ